MSGTYRTIGLLHRGPYTVLDNTFEARLSAMGFTHAQLRCAVAFFRKYARDTENGKHRKLIPFSPECVAREGISTSTYRRTMVYGEGKTWIKQEEGGGASKNHYAAILTWLDSPAPKRNVKTVSHIQTEQGKPSTMNRADPVHAEPGQSRPIALEVMSKGNAKSLPSLPPFATTDFRSLAEYVFLQVRPSVSIPHALEIRVLERALRDTGDLERAKSDVAVYLASGDFEDGESFVPLYKRLCNED
jgi:hypothetical protein